MVCCKVIKLRVEVKGSHVLQIWWPFFGLGLSGTTHDPCCEGGNYDSSHPSVIAFYYYICIYYISVSSIAARCTCMHG